MPARQFLALALLTGACSAPGDPGGNAAEGSAPTPYSVEEIRDANPPGTLLVFRRATPAGVVHEHFEFGEADRERVRLGGKILDDRGHVVQERAASPVPWTELRDHAAFPAALTEVSSGDVHVPAGLFHCKRYDVTRPDGTRETYWFARDRAGPPVLMTIEKRGSEVLRMELLEVRHGAP